jgi:hypothetical protein
MSEKAVQPNVVRIPVHEVEAYLAGSLRQTGDDDFIYVWGRKLLRKDYPNGILAEKDNLNQEYVIRPA